jgi:hypothetical protein
MRSRAVAKLVSRSSSESEPCAEGSAVTSVAAGDERVPALPALPAVAAVRAIGLEGTVAVLEVGGRTVRAGLDPSVHPSVVATAVARGERVVTQMEGGAWVVLGVLRTSPTPGIEEAEEYVIKAGRVRVKAGDEFTVASGRASFAVRAYGAVETIAEQITSRASAVHKIVGRMLHLN